MTAERPELKTFERYFRAVFRLLEGEEDPKEQRVRLQEYLERHADELPDPRLRDFLMELYRERCLRDLRKMREEVGEDDTAQKPGA